MPTDFRSGSRNYSGDERARLAAAGYGGLKAPRPIVKQSMMGQMRKAMDTMGLAPDQPMVETMQKGHSPEDI